MRKCLLSVGLIFSFLMSLAPISVAESICFGTVANGRLENGVQLPVSGKKFSPYSTLAVTLGRTHVHSKVHNVVVAAYQQLEKSAPDKVFVYGETGWANGGVIRPHRTHQNGLSVDFMVPVLGGNGTSMPLPTNALNKSGYDIEFDANGRFDEYSIDFAAIGEHLYQLHTAAKLQGIGIAQVIFSPTYHQRLFATPRGAFLKANLHFMGREAWVRHDEHYHVDFAVACRK